MFYFSSFDESWKVDSEGDVGAFWGLWDKNEKIKFKNKKIIKHNYMNYTDVFSMHAAAAVCYSGYREGQQPGINHPSYEQVKEDLLIVQANWTYVRLYSCDSHSRTVLEVIEKEKLPLQVVVGANINAEENNPNGSW